VGDILLLRRPVFRGGTLTGYAFQDADAEAYVAAMDVEPDDARKLLIEEFFTGLKDDAIWNELVLGYLCAAHTSLAGRINFKAPGTYTAILVSSPTFTVDRGFTGDGVSSKLRTGWDPATLGAGASLPYAQDSASAWLHLTANLSTVNRNLGSTGTCQVKIQAHTSVVGNNSFSVNNANTSDVDSAVLPATALEFFMAQRSTAGAVDGWSGTSEETNAASASNGLPSEQFFCGGTGNSNLARLGACGWGSSLTGKEVLLRARLRTYLQGVGAV
jgi:hypothetical protein